MILCQDWDVFITFLDDSILKIMTGLFWLIVNQLYPPNLESIYEVGRKKLLYNFFLFPV